MSEEIKAGDKAWIWFSDTEKWSSEKTELLSVGKVFVYLFSGCMQITTKATKINPHEKKCELLKEGEELWEYSNGRFGKYSLEQLYYSQIFKRLQGFVVELGNGEHIKANTPMWFTGVRGSLSDRFLSSIETEQYPNKAKIIGVIMSESKQC